MFLQEMSSGCSSQMGLVTAGISGPRSLMLTTWNLNLWSLNAGSDPDLSFFPQGCSGLNCVSPKFHLECQNVTSLGIRVFAGIIKGSI